MVLDVYQTLIIIIITTTVSLNLLKLKQKKIVFCLICGITLAVILAFRDPYSVGVDGIRYYRTYLNSSNASFSELMKIRDGGNIFFYLLCKLFSSMSIPFEWFTFTIAVFNITVLFFFIYKYSYMPFISTFLFLGLGLYTFAFSGLKQSLASSLILIVFDCLIQKRYKLSILLLLVSVLIHPTSIVFLPILFIDIIPLNTITLLFSSLFMFIIALFRIPLGELVTRIGNEDYLGAYELKESIGGTSILIFTLWFFYIVMCKDEFSNVQDNDNREKIYLFFIGLISIFLQLLSSYAYSFTRLNFYYIQFFIIIVPLSLESERIKAFFGKYYILFKAIFCFALCFLMNRLFFGHIKGEMLSNYSFFWE